MNRKQFLATIVGASVVAKAIKPEEIRIHWTDNVAKKYSIVEECEKIRKEAEQLAGKNYPFHTVGRGYFDYITKDEFLKQNGKL